jgi:hypothetical protein
MVKTVGYRPTGSPEEKGTIPGTKQQGQGELISIYINTAKNHPKRARLGVFVIIDLLTQSTKSGEEPY